jgi:hypothetical protein
MCLNYKSLDAGEFYKAEMFFTLSEKKEKYLKKIGFKG